MKGIPIVFIFDLDKTLIGQSEPFNNNNELIKFIKDACKTGKLEGTVCKKNFPSYESLIFTDFFRPGLKKFFEEVKKLLPTAEFFIYSAGTPFYVERFVKIIEKRFDIKFNRPIFSRTECILNENNNYVKSIIARFPEIIDVLSKKYKNIDEELILNSRLIFIDDRTDIVWDDKSTKLITCPAYNYTPVFEIDETILNIIFTEPLVQNYLRSTTQWGGHYNSKELTYNENMLGYYLYMANEHRINLESNKTYLEDTFFEKLINAIKPYKNSKKPFTDEHIVKIRKEISSS